MTIKATRSLLAALIAIGITALAAAALAQSGPMQVIAADDLFTGPDNTDLKPGAGERLRDIVRQAQPAQGPGGPQCPTDVDLTVVDFGSDPLYSEARAAARLEVIEDYLLGLGPSVRVNSKSTTGKVSTVAIRAQIPQDQEPPRLDTTWTPPKGTKVEPGARIKVTMVARDDANFWQRGIKTIQLVADSEGGRFIASENYDQVNAAGICAALPARRVEATYIVPSNPPPFVRLTALAEDHVGLGFLDVGEFPTKGDWFGTLELSSDGVVGGVRTTIIDQMRIVLNYDGRGNLEGTLVADRSFKQDSPDCPWEIAIPNKLRGKLLGSYTPGTPGAEAMSLQLVEPVVAPAPRKDCPGGGYIYSGDSAHEVPEFIRVLRSPRAAGKDVFSSSAEWATGPMTNRISLTLRRVRLPGKP